MTLPPYPDAARQDLTETIHGHEVADPYRWLEDAGSEQTKAWLAGQEELYESYLAGVPGREKLAERLSQLLAAGEIGPPVWRGDRQFFTRREPGQEHAVLYTVSAAGAERPLIDPVTIDPTGVTTLDRWHPDREGRLLAYQLSVGGREESELRVMDVATGEDVDGPIDRCRYSDVAWLPGGAAFYYTRRLAPEACPRARISSTAASTCIRWAARPARTCSSSARAWTRPTTTAWRSARMAAGSQSPPQRALPRATTCGSPTCRCPRARRRRPTSR